jgi:hypothetical protein
MAAGAPAATIAVLPVTACPQPTTGIKPKNTCKSFVDDTFMICLRSRPAVFEGAARSFRGSAAHERQ